MRANKSSTSTLAPPPLPSKPVSLFLSLQSIKLEYDVSGDKGDDDEMKSANMGNSGCFEVCMGS